ncbi:ArsR/SmtB family transcription factor [Achromobacter xylosoxidans]|uniref:ArsR/SmtB family transcription factor n=2 Tax=Achromobacter TaxID=222 RepID=UPI000B48EEFE|nr:helix-turn-helix transcriptional regulator [Achromobacter denitrificans]
MEHINSPAARPQAVVRALAPARPSQTTTLDAVLTLTALSHSTRLGIFRMLIRQEPHGMDAGEIALVVGGPRSTVSQHLAGLARAGLIVGHRTDDYVRYRARLSGIYGLLEFILEECCATDPCGCLPNDAESFWSVGEPAR